MFNLPAPAGRTKINSCLRAKNSLETGGKPRVSLLRILLPGSVIELSTGTSLPELVPFSMEKGIIFLFPGAVECPGSAEQLWSDRDPG